MNLLKSLLLSLACAATAAEAQSYEELWNKVEQATGKDLPKTALQHVIGIEQKAQADGDAAQLLRAQLMKGVFLKEISTDSVVPYIQLLEESLAGEERPVVCALYHAALAKLYQGLLEEWEVTDRDLKLTKLREHFAASLANPEALASEKTEAWLPLFQEGKLSRVFGYDLLHTLYYQAQSLDRLPADDRQVQRQCLIDFYRRRGNRDAVVMLELDRLEAEMPWRPVDGLIAADDSFEALRRLTRDYAAQAATVFVYEKMLSFCHWGSSDSFSEKQANDSLLAQLAREGIERYGADDVYGRVSLLRNSLTGLTQPAVELQSIPEGYYPGTKDTLQVQMRACTEAQLRFYQLTGNGVEYDRLENSLGEVKAIGRLLQGKKAVYEQRIVAPAAEAWKWQQVNVEITLPQVPGVYVAELTNAQGMKRRAPFRITANYGLLFPLPEGGTRLRVVDGLTGNPVKQAVATLYTQRYEQIRRLNAEENDCILLPTQNWSYRNLAYFSTPADQGGKCLSLSSNRGRRDKQSQRVNSTVDLFSDRLIYRPGQTVCFSATAYESQGDDFRAVAGLSGEVTLYDVNYKKVDSLPVRTDEWGTLKGQFRLPEAALPGRYQLEFTGGAFRKFYAIKVEEYRRPTFTVEASLPDTAYALGDRIEVSGLAQTYTGVPLAQAKVTYRVSRRSWWYRSGESMQPQTGETVTDAAGRFTLPVELTPPAPADDAGFFNRYTFEIQYTVTADNGETQEGKTELLTATEPAFYEVEMPATLCREHLPEVRISLCNAAGRHLGEEVAFRVVDEAGRTLLADSRPNGASCRLPAEVRSLASGIYYLVVPAGQGAKEKRVRFVLFSENDKQPVDTTASFFAYTRPTDRKDTAFVLVGTPERDATLFYDLVTSDRVIESRQFSLSDTLLAFDVAYRPEMGDGATMYFALVRDGKLYEHRVCVEKPKPEKRLVMEWESFRSLLEPGQDEEWTLRITYPDGTPAPASLLASLHDASLDVYGAVERDFTSVCFTRRFASSSYDYEDWNEWAARSLEWSKGWKAEKVSPIRWTYWKKELCGYLGSAEEKMVLSEKSAFMYNQAEDAPAGAPPPARAISLRGTVAKKGAADGDPGQPLRTNFAETAFFLPQLRTDSTGRISLAFRLPESLTRWHFTALAHTRAMDYAQLDTHIVARKTLMAEAALPRFVRQGDHTLLPVKLTSLSDRPMKVKLSVTLEEWQHGGGKLVSEQLEVELPAGETKVIELPYTCCTEAAALRFRVKARSEAFSDGEERLLPVLSDRVEVTRTLPFTLTEAGTHTVDLAPLREGYRSAPRSLNVELTSNPTWYAVTALPVLADNPLSLSATDWAESFYALALGEKLVTLNPEIRAWAETAEGELSALAERSAQGLGNATPWAMQGDKLRQRGRALTQFFDPAQAAGLRRTSLDKLRALQQPDGSWSWCPGMSGSAYITVDVAIQLARVQRLAENYEGREMLARAQRYLRSVTAESVRSHKREEKRTGREQEPSELDLRYLYLQMLLGERPDADAKFLLERAARLRHELTMYGQALGAVVLAEFGYDAEARLNLESLLEHTVTAPDKGRWFETARALASYDSYRIPTQCAAIEALAHFGREAEADEMRRWLLQAKRTQAWETSRATAEAVYALLATAGTSYSVTALQPAPLAYSLTKGRKTVAEGRAAASQTAQSAGYVNHTLTDAAQLEAQQLRIDKPQPGTSWGCVYATYSLPADEVLTEGSDLRVSRRWEIWRGGQWQRLAPNEAVRKGDRLRQVYSLRAERDFDFVSLNASRAACLEPVESLSGYRWHNGLSVYRAVRDASTDFFIERLPKGDHELAEELFVVRAGRYTTGIARTQSVFAPEFSGTTATDELRAE